MDQCTLGKAFQMAANAFFSCYFPPRLKLFNFYVCMQDMIRIPEQQQCCELNTRSVLAINHFNPHFNTNILGPTHYMNVRLLVKNWNTFLVGILGGIVCKVI